MVTVDVDVEMIEQRGGVGGKCPGWHLDENAGLPDCKPRAQSMVEVRPWKAEVYSTGLVLRKGGSPGMT